MNRNICAVIWLHFNIRVASDTDDSFEVAHVAPRPLGPLLLHLTVHFVCRSLALPLLPTRSRSWRSSRSSGYAAAAASRRCVFHSCCGCAVLPRCPAAVAAVPLPVAAVRWAGASPAVALTSFHARVAGRVRARAHDLRPPGAPREAQGEAPPRHRGPPPGWQERLKTRRPRAPCPGRPFAAGPSCVGAAGCA